MMMMLMVMMVMMVVMMMIIMMMVAVMMVMMMMMMDGDIPLLKLEALGNVCAAPLAWGDLAGDIVDEHRPQGKHSTARPTQPSK